MGKTNPILGHMRNRLGGRYSYATQSDMIVGDGGNWVRFIIFNGTQYMVPDGVESRNRRFRGVAPVGAALFLGSRHDIPSFASLLKGAR